MVAKAVALRLRNPDRPVTWAVHFINYHLVRNEKSRVGHWKARGLDAPPRSTDKFQPPRRPRGP